MKRAVYVFGNEDVPEDSVPFMLYDRLSADLPMLKFVKVAPNADLPFRGARERDYFRHNPGIPEVKVFDEQGV